MADLNNGYGKMKSIYRMSDPQPDWSQTDPSQPDYIKNKEGAQEVRPICVNGEEVLSANVSSGPLNLVAGRNIAMKAEGNNVIIASTASGGGEGDCGCLDLIEGDCIDIIDDDILGQRTIALEKGSITDEYIESISMSKLVQDKNEILILNGGKANGYN